jgi:hypothetical protein
VGDNPYTPIAKIDRQLLEDAIKADPIIILVTRRTESAEELRVRFAAIGKVYGPAQIKSFATGTITVPLLILK